MKKKKFMIFMALACLMLIPAGAHALPISGTGYNGGSFSGTIDIGYSYDSLNTATPWLLISLTNSSANDSLFIAGYALPGGAMSEIGLVQVGGTWTGRQPLTTFNRVITAESFANGFVVYFSDVRGALQDKAPIAVAEPSTLIMLGSGLLVLGLGIRRRAG